MSKQVADRESASRAVIDAITEHETAIATKHTELLGGAAARLSKSVPDVGVLLQLYAETLRFSAETLTKASALRPHHSTVVFDLALPKDDPCRPRLDRSHTGGAWVKPKCRAANDRGQMASSRSHPIQLGCVLRFADGLRRPSETRNRLLASVDSRRLR